MKHEIKHQEIIRNCQFELATNFESPAVRILAFYGSQIGLTADEMKQALETAVRS